MKRKMLTFIFMVGLLSAIVQEASPLSSDEQAKEDAFYAGQLVALLADVWGSIDRAYTFIKIGLAKQEKNYGIKAPPTETLDSLRNTWSKIIEAAKTGRTGELFLAYAAFRDAHQYLAQISCQPDFLFTSTIGEMRELSNNMEAQQLRLQFFVMRAIAYPPRAISEEKKKPK